MRDTRVSADDLRAAIERTGYYPGLVTDAVWSALGPEPVQAYVVQHDAIFDPGMEVRRHITVLALTPTRLIYSHTDEHPAEEPDTRAQAETSTEAVRFSRVSFTRKASRGEYFKLILLGHLPTVALVEIRVRL